MHKKFKKKLERLSNTKLQIIFCFHKLILDVYKLAKAYYQFYYIYIIDYNDNFSIIKLYLKLF